MVKEQHMPVSDLSPVILSVKLYGFQSFLITVHTPNRVVRFQIFNELSLSQKTPQGNWNAQIGFLDVGESKNAQHEECWRIKAEE
jgi:hypothetical protein